MKVLKESRRFRIRRGRINNVIHISCTIDRANPRNLLDEQARISEYRFEAFADEMLVKHCPKGS